MFSEMLFEILLPFLNKRFPFSGRAVIILYGPVNVMWFVYFPIWTGTAGHSYECARHDMLLLELIIFLLLFPE